MIENYTLAYPREITECSHLYTIPIILVHVEHDLLIISTCKCLL